MERIMAYVVIISSVIETEQVSMRHRHVFLPSQKDEAFEFARSNVNNGIKVSFEILLAHFEEQK